MKQVVLLLAYLLIIGVSLVMAQTKPIGGSVTSAGDGAPIPGVSVVVKGTTIGTVTDINGKYQLNVPSGATTLVFSFIGMKTQDVTIGNQSTIDARLLEDVFGIDEVVVSGVASETPRKKLAVSVGKVDEKDLKQVPAFSAGSALQGKKPA